VANTSALLADEGYPISLLILDETAESFYPLHKDISVLQKPLFFDITDKGNWVTRKFAFLNDLTVLKRTLKELNPHIVITTEYHFSVMAVLSGIQSSARILSWEHHHFNLLKRNRFWRMLYKKCYPRLDCIIPLNRDEETLFKSVNSNTYVIPNFIVLHDRSVIEKHQEKLILTIVRLNKVKGIDLLLQVAKVVLKKHPNWKWQLIGQGVMRETVLDFIEKESLQDRLMLIKPQSHKVWDDYKRSSFFVLPSRHECFPMVLLEAMSTGLPCLSFDCETGPRDIIADHVDGFLIEKENIPMMIDAIERMIIDKDLRYEMSEMAFQNVQRFSPEAVLKLWKCIIDQ
jgi:amylovoran biosynthesis glycosyltransferase AmsD